MGDITHSLIYWITRLDDIRMFLEGTSTVLFFISGIGLFFLIFWYVNYKTNSLNIETAPPRSLFKIAIPLLLIGLILSFTRIFVPTTKDMAAIVVIPMFANAKPLTAIYQDLYGLADEWIEELRPNERERPKTIK